MHLETVNNKQNKICVPIKILSKYVNQFKVQQIQQETKTFNY